MKISAVVLTKNEASNIARCINSVLFCDEIIIIDDYSTDDTLNQISRIKLQNDRVKFKVIQRHLNNNFGGQRNFAIKQASNDWILFVDADEVVSNELRSEIQKLQFDKVSYYLKRRDWFWGRELRYGEVKKLRQQGIIRLVKKGGGQWIGQVHEVYKSIQPIGHLNSYLNHYPHPNINQFLTKINYYSSLRAEELLKYHTSVNVITIIIYPVFKFFVSYFILLGFLDGQAGFTYSFLMSFHSFLVRVKLWQLIKGSIKV